MNKNIEVSVIIPMYNSERTIERALNSVISQTYQDNIEIIVINDGSKDNSLKIVEEYKVSLKNENIDMIIINKENGGVSSARNQGLKKAKGKYIALLDSDDEWYDKKLEVQIDLLKENKGIDLLGTTLNGKVFKQFFFKKFTKITQISVLDLIFKNFFQPSTVIFKKDILLTIGLFPENQKYAEEGNFFLKASNNFNCFLINECYLNFGDGKRGFGESGLSSNLKEMQKGELKNLKFALESKYISLFIYIVAYIYSQLKYFRRIVLTKAR